MHSAPTTSAATAAALVNTRTVDELAAGGIRFDQAISAAPWTAPSTTSIVTGLYAHHHGYLHWDAQLDPTTETLFRAFAAHGYAVASFVFDTNYLFKDLPEANVLGTSESLDGAFEWLRANREQPFLLYVHNWATHMPYDIRHADRKDWLAAKEEVIGDPVRLRVRARGDARVVPKGGRAPVGGARRVASRSARDPRPARVDRARVPPTTASPGGSASPRRRT